jgi:hypothetical protein
MTSQEQKRECLKAKTNELEINSENKNIRDLHRGMNEFNLKLTW